jgi:Family of unknown function (DUF6364)
MDTKLTLSIDRKVIERAKKYAKQERRSISDIVENYLKLLTNDIRRDEVNEVQEKKGKYIIKDKWRGAFKLNFPDDVDYKEILEEEIWKKHMK